MDNQNLARIQVYILHMDFQCNLEHKYKNQLHFALYNLHLLHKEKDDKVVVFQVVRNRLKSF